MFNHFKNKLDKDDISMISLACLLIHAARIDENYSEKEKQIVRDFLIKLGADINEVDKIIEKAELEEKDANQILEFTKTAKNLRHENKLVLIEALWSIIYSDQNVDMYEANLMRRLSGLLYLDKKMVGDIKEKIKLRKL